MNEKDKKRIEKLMKVFEENVIIQTNAIWKEADAKKGNKAAKKYIKAFEKISAMGDEAKEEFSKLLEHESADVRSTAAAFLLRYCTERAEKVLKEVAKQDGIIAFEASQALKNWEEGDWDLDPEN